MARWISLNICSAKLCCAIWKLNSPMPVRRPFNFIHSKVFPTIATILLSALAYAGQSDSERVAAAFTRRRRLSRPHRADKDYTLLPEAQCDLEQVDLAA